MLLVLMTLPVLSQDRGSFTTYLYNLRGAFMAPLFFLLSAFILCYDSDLMRFMPIMALVGKALGNPFCLNFFPI